MHLNCSTRCAETVLGAAAFGLSVAGGSPAAVLSQRETPQYSVRGPILLLLLPSLNCTESGETSVTVADESVSPTGLS